MYGGNRWNGFTPESAITRPPWRTAWDVAPPEKENDAISWRADERDPRIGSASPPEGINVGGNSRHYGPTSSTSGFPSAIGQAPPYSLPSSYHHHQVQSPQLHAHTPSFDTSSLITRSTLWWGDLEPWMDEEYAKQVCNLMGWNDTSKGGVTIKIPHPSPDPMSGTQANNPGYCFLTFPTPQSAANVLAQITQTSTQPLPLMPNSSRPFNMNWATSSTTAALTSAVPTAPTTSSVAAPREHSIFVGDLAPETSNSDLVAVFRNPVLGLRNDREPKFIRPFYSCKSAKIMLDPVTGVSRGYGFVRFTDEADQQRALIEMHGLYCLSRPMRVSPATAKFKSPSPTVPRADGPALPLSIPSLSSLPSLTLSPSSSRSLSDFQPSQSVESGLTASVSATLASDSPPSSASGTFKDPSKLNDLSSLSQNISSLVSGNPPVHDLSLPGQANEDAAGWAHPANAQARAILSNLIGPNGEQLTSADPYNTTVFVGGLSPLISEDTLRTFFAPFGEIHYVKVPVGKHCGFVQFVRKADAERAIERMQGFPIGGSRIRLSWGRSQYKAAQAAAQQAQASQAAAAAAAAAQQQQQQQVLQQTAASVPALASLTHEQAISLLQKLGYGALAQGDVDADALRPVLDQRSELSGPLRPLSASTSFDVPATVNKLGDRAGLGADNQEYPKSAFAPFGTNQNSTWNADAFSALPKLRSEPLPHPSSRYAPGFGPIGPGEAANKTVNDVLSSVSQSTLNPGSRPFNMYAASSAASKAPGFKASDILRTDVPLLARRPGSANSSSRASPLSNTSPVNPPNGKHAADEELEDLNGTLKSLNLDKKAAARSPSPDSPAGSDDEGYRASVGSPSTRSSASNSNL
ncbi:hypothetical protein SISSUDRAFT_1065285 [Sistotremastrum suecicum HHB10207 ss-3]|uniref:RRM domain-containing protein n=1 Tax=Sistotremastrum suecicum HHB10207 ss-3 TaxID=1314776 RepID=A0A165ZNW8_9AGAM|nr:hypothetical protein SISSUDRAFT_1065285 [Sistotremastrum suecicum HHB10207 ss-3]